MINRQAKAVVLDAWSVMAYLEGEPASEGVEAIIAECHQRDIPLLMSVVNVAEIWYAFARRSSDAKADQGVQELEQLGIRFVEASLELALDAAKFKARHKMSLADCFAAAVAKRNGARLVTGDQEFRQVEADIEIEWLPPATAL